MKRLSRGGLGLVILILAGLALLFQTFQAASTAAGGSGNAAPSPVPAKELFSRDNLVVWCIVPFDAKKRGPEERVAMLRRLGFTRFAYDWRAEHLPTFETEIAALQRERIRLEAVWFPAGLNAEGRRILDVLKRSRITTQLWVTMGDPSPAAKTQVERVQAAARVLRPIAEEAAKINCKVALYNHGGWFGEPENQIAIIEHLKLPHLGIVYNLHHGHDHLDRFPHLLRKMLPHVYALNLNGMVREGDKKGQKILPLGQGDRDLQILKVICESGYRGPIGLLGHTMDDAEERLRDNLEGLDWLVKQLDGKPAGPRPKPRTPVPAATHLPVAPPGGVSAGKELAYSREMVATLAAEAKGKGNAKKGAEVFRSPQFACLSYTKSAIKGASSALT